MVQFPKNFFWGAATSSYQVEGNNSNADWWSWEPKAGKERSGQACRHYELYQKDFDLAKSLNHNSHRLSIEWSRIEPSEGQFDQKEIDHYVEVVKALRQRGLEPMVTLHHFTNPQWLSDRGGWTNPSCIKFFVRYCGVMAGALGRQVHWWFTINEPTVYFSHAFLWGMWPPQSKSFLKTRAVHDHMLAAHREAYQKIHQVYLDLNIDAPSVGLAHHMQAIVPCTRSFKDRLAVRLREYWYNLEMLDHWAESKTLDFIGVNYYSRNLVHVHSWWIGNLLMETCKDNHHPLKKNALEWDIYPEGITQVLLSLRKYNLPVLVSENGICTSDDNQRWDYIHSHVKAVHQAMAAGANVIGYLYWSLMDNFEWAYGFGPRFGLIDIDYKTFQRTVRESARKFAHICQTGALP